MITAIAILLSLTMLVFNYSLNKDIFYPPALFSLIWSLILLIYLVFVLVNGQHGFYIDSRCYICFIGGQVIFTLGGLLATNRKLKHEGSEHKAAISYAFDKYLLWFLVFMLPVYIFRLYQVAEASSISGANIFIVLRYEFAVEGVDVGWVKYLN